MMLLTNTYLLKTFQGDLQSFNGALNVCVNQEVIFFTTDFKELRITLNLVERTGAPESS